MKHQTPLGYLNDPRHRASLKTPAIERRKMKSKCNTVGVMSQDHTKCLLCIFLPLSLLLSAFSSHQRSLSSITDRIWEMCASSNVWMYFSFCWQSRGSEGDTPATLLHLACCYTYLDPQKMINCPRVEWSGKNWILLWTLFEAADLHVPVVTV